jgi:hypothetical protein
MPNYPGTNLLFEGKNNIGRVLSVTDRLFNESTPTNRIGHPIVVDGEDIYVFAVKDEYAGNNAFNLARESRMGGYEAAAASYVALNENDFNRFAKGELRIKQLFEKAMFSPGEKNLYNLVK